MGLSGLGLSELKKKKSVQRHGRNYSVLRVLIVSYDSATC